MCAAGNRYNSKSKGSDRNFKAFVKELKADELKPIVLLTGREEFQINWAAGEIKNRYISSATELMDYQIMDEEDHNNIDGIIAACNTFSMLSNKKVIWVRGWKLLNSQGVPNGYNKEDIEKLVDYIENANEGSILIMSYPEFKDSSPVVKAAKANGSFFEFGSLTRPELSSFALKRFKEAGISITKADMEFLVDETGYFNKESEYYLHNFQNDLLKLISVSSDGLVRREDIEELILGDGEKFVFTMLDGISGNNKSKAYEVLFNRMAGAKEDEKISILGSIVSQMELLLMVVELMDSPKGKMSASQIAKYVGMNEIRNKKAM